MKSPEAIPAAFDPKVGNVFALVAMVCWPVTTTAAVLDELVAYEVVAFEDALTLVVPEPRSAAGLPYLWW